MTKKDLISQQIEKINLLAEILIQETKELQKMLENPELLKDRLKDSAHTVSMKFFKVLKDYKTLKDLEENGDNE